MKKTYSLLFWMMIALGVAVSQNDGATESLWCDSFDDGIADGWLLVDNDGNGKNWKVETFHPYDGGYSLFGPAYTNSTEDNWAVSPSINLTDGVISLTWQVFAHESYNETYEVWVTTGDAEALESYDSLFAETVTGGYYARTLDISAYAGQTIHVAFRHRSTFQNYLCIDSVCVTASVVQLPSVEIVAPDSALVGASVVLVAVSDNAESYEWSVEGASISSPTQQQIEAVWLSEGCYEIVLTAVNSAGRTTVSRYIDIVEKADINGTGLHNVAVYPNPVEAALTVEAEGLIELEILDATGAVVLRSTDCKGFVDLSAVPAGIYYVRISTREGCFARKIIKR